MVVASGHRRHPDEGEHSATCSCTWSGRDPQLPPDKVNQDRGNSGVFLQDVYEVQVLDNFENPTYVNGMVGSIYKQFPPLVNAALPGRDTGRPTTSSSPRRASRPTAR